MKFVAFAAAMFLRLLHATVRLRHVHVQNIDGQPQYIVALWHQDLLLSAFSRYRKPISVMISQSRDGELIARAFAWWGVEAARGSATRGGTAALRELIRQSREGKNIVFTPDGPKGPARVVKDGVIGAARATGLPIIPMAFAAKKKSYWALGIA